MRFAHVRALQRQAGKQYALYTLVAVLEAWGSQSCISWSGGSLQVADRSKRKALKLLAMNAVATAEQLDNADAMDKASLSAAVDAALSFAPLLSEYFIVTGVSSA